MEEGENPFFPASLYTGNCRQNIGGSINIDLIRPYLKYEKRPELINVCANLDD